MTNCCLLNVDGLSILRVDELLFTQFIISNSWLFFQAILKQRMDKRKKLAPAGQTCTRVAKSSWKKKIKISSLALSLCSELASNPWSLPLNSHPASTFSFLCLGISSWPIKNNPGACWCQRKFLAPPVWIWPFLITWKCLSHKAVNPWTPHREVVRVLTDAHCNIVTR